MSEDTTLAGTPSPKAAEKDAAPIQGNPVPTDEESAPHNSTESTDMGGDSSTVGEELPPLPPPTECEFEVSEAYKTGVAKILNELIRAGEALSMIGEFGSRGMEDHLRKEATRYAYTRLCGLHKSESQKYIVDAPTPPTE